MGFLMNQIKLLSRSSFLLHHGSLFTVTVILCLKQQKEKHKKGTENHLPRPYSIIFLQTSI